MAIDQSAVTLLDEGRVVRLFGERAGANEAVDRRPDVVPAGNDVGFFSPDRRRHEAMRARLDDGLEHKLREPVSTIATIAGVLRHQVPRTQADQMAAIEAAAARADTMFRDLLSFVRSEMGGMRPVRRRLDLKVLCERVVDAISTAHPDRPMVFTSDRRIIGEWDADALETLLSKLVLNAIEHGLARPAIRIGVHALPGAALIEVWNAGRIVDRDLLARIFEPFASGRGSGSDGRSGLGLGLYLVREIARGHGGDVEVESNDGEGTTFRVTLARAGDERADLAR